MMTTPTTSRVLLLVLLLATLGCAAAAGRATTPGRPEAVAVTFAHPERFTDVKDDVIGSERGAAALLGDLGRFLSTMGDRYVPPGQRLEIIVTDIDLAGAFEPWRGPQVDRVRIMRDIYPPRIELDFRLLDPHGAVVRQGHRVLRDPRYLRRAALGESDRLRYDKALLRDWLNREFGVLVSRP
jgi:Protein of unknown function (DUF3016)